MKEVSPDLGIVQGIANTSKAISQNEPSLSAYPNLMVCIPLHEENFTYRVLKRLLDLFMAITTLIVFGPFLLLIYALIRLESPGPGIFSQERSGRRYRIVTKRGIEYAVQPIKVYKFRTMYHNPDANREAHLRWIQAWKNGEFSDDPNAVVKPVNDPRVTRLGRFLRSSSIDELPQVINVLKGEMSIVGPRPLPLYEINEIPADYQMRLNVKPGVTGLWQIKLRGRGTLEQMIELDNNYIENRSFWLDLQIILLTIPAVILGQGAR